MVTKYEAQHGATVSIHSVEGSLEAGVEFPSSLITKFYTICTLTRSFLASLSLSGGAPAGADSQPLPPKKKVVKKKVPVEPPAQDAAPAADAAPAPALPPKKKKAPPKAPDAAAAGEPGAPDPLAADVPGPRSFPGDPGFALPQAPPPTAW